MRAQDDTGAIYEAYLTTKKKYKPVHLKTRPVKAALPSEFRIVRDIKGDPLADMPRIDYANIPDFVPTGRYTEERMRAMDANHGEWMYPEERKLLHHFMCLFNRAFA